MGKKFFKWLIPLSIGAVLFGSHLSFAGNTNTKTDAASYSSPYTTLSTASNVTINNEKLRNYLHSIFEKTSNQSFKSDDFLNSPLFAPTTTTDPETGISTTNIPTYQLDLSNTGITDISELSQFEFPENIKAINLSGNGITGGDLQAITQVLNLQKDSQLIIGDRTITSATNFSSQIVAINFNNNNIDLNQTSSTYLNDNRLLFGLQNIGNIDSTGMVRKGEINPCFYIRADSDENYLTYTFTNALCTNIGSSIITKNKVINLSDIDLDDKYIFEVKSIADSPTAGFDGYNFKVEFTQFDLTVDSNFFVERKHLLDLKVDNDGKLLEGSPLKLSGFGNNNSIKISYNNVSTSRITTDTHKNYVNITIQRGDDYRIIPIEFVVKDTIEPVIKLIGSSHAYSSRNKNYDDPGVIAYDPAFEGDESGDDLTAMVVRDDTDLNVTILGSYTIRYSVSDIAGNTKEITRIVEIQERVLDNITLRINGDAKVTDGEDIILVVQPDGDIPISAYKDIKYYWYLNDTDTPIEETLGDSISGKSTITLVANSADMKNIRVKMIATQRSDNGKIELYSNTIYLEITPSLRNDNTLIISAAVAVLIIIIVITIVTIVKYRKSKNKTHGKHKNFHKGKKPKKGSGDSKKDDRPEIQVIKNYSGTGTGVAGSSGETGGGNSNFRPPESDGSNGMNK